MARSLISAGFEVISATDGNEAIAAVTAHSFVAAVVDHQLPGRPGTEILAALRVSQPNCVRILA
ncbi:MAG: response regulator [Myxococcales bacterium]|nr:response regulator [Myxococcales bacterium]